MIGYSLQKNARPISRRPGELEMNGRLWKINFQDIKIYIHVNFTHVLLLGRLLTLWPILSTSQDIQFVPENDHIHNIQTIWSDCKL